MNTKYEQSTIDGELNHLAPIDIYSWSHYSVQHNILKANCQVIQSDLFIP